MLGLNVYHSIATSTVKTTILGECIWFVSLSFSIFLSSMWATCIFVMSCVLPASQPVCVAKTFMLDIAYTLFNQIFHFCHADRHHWLLPFRGFPTTMVYLYYISCLRYTILVGNPRFYTLFTDLDLALLGVTRLAQSKTSWFNFLTLFSTNQDEIWYSIEAIQAEHFDAFFG